MYDDTQYYSMKEIKEQLSDGLDNNEDIIVESLSVNRKYVRITYESDLNNDDIAEILSELLEDYELYAINYTTESNESSEQTRDVVTFSVR